MIPLRVYDLSRISLIFLNYTFRILIKKELKIKLHFSIGMGFIIEPLPWRYLKLVYKIWYRLK